MCDNVELPNNGQLWAKLRSGWQPSLPQYSKSLRKLICMMMHPNPRLRPSGMHSCCPRLKSLPSCLCVAPPESCCLWVTTGDLCLRISCLCHCIMELGEAL